MSISEEWAKWWAEEFILSWISSFEYSAVYEDEEFTANYPDEEDWQAVLNKIGQARIGVTWSE